MMSHSSSMPGGVSTMKCKCSQCGTEQFFVFYLSAGPSLRTQEDDRLLKIAEDICNQAAGKARDMTAKGFQHLREAKLMQIFLEELETIAEEKTVEVRCVRGLTTLAAAHNTGIIGYYPTGLGLAIMECDEVILDAAIEVGGQRYCGSYCWTAGEKESELQAEAHKVLEMAIEEAKQSIANRTVQTYEELAETVRVDIEDAGFGKYGYWQQIHSIYGDEENLHSFPLAHDQNGSSPKGIIRDGDVISLSPGIYVPNFIGFRKGVTLRVRL